MEKYTYLVLGTGVGRVIAWWLLQQDDTARVILSDLSARKAKMAVDSLPLKNGQRDRILCAQIDVVNEANDLPRMFREADVIISAVPASFDPLIVRACLDAMTPVCNLGGVVDATREQLTLKDEAQYTGVRVVTDCGLMPGLGNVMARYLATWFAPDTPYTITVTAGGVPLKPEGPYNYQQIYSAEGTYHMAYDWASRLVDGAVEEVEARRTFRTIFTPPALRRLVPFDTMEVFASSGAALAPWDLRDYGVKSFTEMTVRWPGFEQFLLDNPGGRFQKAFSLLPPTDAEHPDAMYLLVSAMAGYKKGAAFELIDVFDEKTGFSAIERTTAFPAAIIAKWLARGEFVAGVATCDQALDVIDATKPYLAEVGLHLPFSFNGINA
jgi:lysine 6-dehydrogenase